MDSLVLASSLCVTLKAGVRLQTRRVTSGGVSQGHSTGSVLEAHSWPVMCSPGAGASRSSSRQVAGVLQRSSALGFRGRERHSKALHLLHPQCVLNHVNMAWDPLKN